jgi:glycosyltransferase involved in cell wall biosynthesis
VSVLPYPLKAENYPYIERCNSGEVTVGFVGHVHLRKGVPYFVEVAKRLRGLGIRFVMLGPIYINSSVVDANKDVVDFVGAVPRSQVRDWLGRFDLLLFPSTCEGSATAVLEAMATGLPVVTSPNSGTVARHGTEGFITAYDQIDAMADAVERLASNPGLRQDMGRAASRRASEYTIDWYSREIGRVLTSLLEISRDAGVTPRDAVPAGQRPVAPTRLAV